MVLQNDPRTRRLRETIIDLSPRAVATTTTTTTTTTKELCRPRNYDDSKKLCSKKIEKTKSELELELELGESDLVWGPFSAQAQRWAVVEESYVRDLNTEQRQVGHGWVGQGMF